MNTVRKINRAFASLSILGLLLPVLGCSPMSHEEPTGEVSSAVTIAQVFPPEEEAAGPQGHTIRLNRPIWGFDALPSPENEASGVAFTAECGYVDLERDGKIVAIGTYVKGDAKVQFKNALSPGKHYYKAFYRPSPSAAQCGVMPWQYFGRAYESGGLEVVVENGIYSGKYKDRCDSCPAWCDSDHPLFIKMNAKFPGKCGGVADVNFCAGKAEGWWCSNDRKSLLRCDGKGKIGTGQKFGPKACTNCTVRPGANDACLNEEERLFPGLAVYTGKFSPPAQPTAYDYAIAVVDLQHPAVQVKSLVGANFEPTEALLSSAVQHDSIPGKETSKPAGVPSSSDLSCLPNPLSAVCHAAPNDAGTVFTINAAPWGHPDGLFPSSFWPTRTLRANGQWLRWGANDDVLLIGDGEARIRLALEEPLPEAWPHVIGNLNSLLIQNGNVPSDWGSALDVENSWSLAGVSEQGRYLFLLATAGQNWKFYDHGLTRRDLANLALTPRTIGGVTTVVYDALMLDGGHATQAWLDGTHLVHGQAKVLSGLSIISSE